jgi:pimeloyl-ACP methyl ester carboxylesterase
MRPSDQRTSIRLAGGRRLSYTAAGPTGGFPVVYCHGAIGTPLGRSVDLERIAWELGVRHISVSRPGLGGSDPLPGRTLTDFAADLRELMAGLGHERFSVVGVSAGGPYALAAARELPEMVDRVAVCSSLSPLCALHRTPGMEPRIRLALRALAAAPGLWTAVGDASMPVVRRSPWLLSRVIAAHAAPCERERLGREVERRRRRWPDRRLSGLRRRLGILTSRGDAGGSPVARARGPARPARPRALACGFASSLPRVLRS